MSFVYGDIAGMIDHALLRPEFSDIDLSHGLFLARDYQVASVCILPFAVTQARDLLAGSSVKTTTTIGFPHGAQATCVKAAEALQALDEGAEELDMVVNISKVLSGDWTYVRADIQAVLEPTHDAGEKLKLIFENAYLSEDEKKRLCHIGCELGVDWLKTSTGFASTGATLEDTELMTRLASQGVEVKASGGIRDLDTLLEYRNQGVTRVGTSSTDMILEETRRRLKLPPIRGSSL